MVCRMLRVVCVLHLACAGGCQQAASPWQVSPLGHGGRPAQWGPGPHSPPWRANLVAAPGAQICTRAARRHDIACAIPRPDAAYGQALPALEARAEPQERIAEDDFVR